DLVPGKGQGLVILLYGTSGVGKTLTAESVAAYTGRPLLKVSLADIGVDVTRVEKKLDALFQLASKWEAVLLFDEADTMLEARSIEGNLSRNAIVSMFLKVLEYYEGILMLTTNRIKTFDVAVQSRVNLGIQFPDMDEEEQKRVFRVFLNQISEEDKDAASIENWLQSEYDDLKYNARQIRNIMSSAMDLA
ncbi:P-loop containing nucleoside triphosphate hydrolase protein, partial [Leptodontidium sp. 2 PMI_412]